MGIDHENDDGGHRIAWITNWREYEAPFTSKLWLALRNNWIKLRNRSACCGNNGEPGC